MGPRREFFSRGFLSNFRPDDGWYWIWDDPSLSVHEKAVAQSIVRRQYRGNPVLLTRETIGSLAGVSRSQVIRCEASLVSRGMLRMEPTRHRHVFLYCVSRVQLDLFDRKNLFSPGCKYSPDPSALVENPVEYAVGNTASTARLADASAGTVPTRDDEPPDCSHQEQIETEHLRNSKSKTRAEVRLRAANSPADEEQKRRIEARNRRVEGEIEQLVESRAGLSREIYPEEWRRCMDRIGARAKSLQPMSAKQFNERKKLLAEQAKRIGHD